MNFPDAVKSAFSNYVKFSGRATRSEYWYWVLFVFIVLVVLQLVTGSFSGAVNTAPHAVNAAFDTYSRSPLISLFYLIIFLPSLALACRRLHDIDKSGWWQLLALIPLIGTIILIIWYATKGSLGPNRYSL